MPSKRMLRRIVRPESMRPRLATLRLWVSPPCSERASRRIDSSNSIRSCSPTRSTSADRPVVALHHALLQRQQRLQVPLDRLGQPGQHPAEPAAQRGRVVLGAVLGLLLDVG